jgi:predicted nucleic acid-binding protein
MNADFPVVLDTCVLVPVALCDTSLRLAERRLFLPRWSSQTSVELERALVNKIGLSPEKARRRITKMQEHFRDALVSGYESLLPAMTNQEKDKNVLAAAVEAVAEVIVTLNLKDFPERALAPLKVEAPIKLDLGFASYESSSSVKENVLHYTRTYTVREVTLPADKYSDVQKLAGVIAADEQNNAVLKKQ